MRNKNLADFLATAPLFFCRGSESADTINGQGGNDAIFGSCTRTDPLFGGTGADALCGEAGSDILIGGAMENRRRIAATSACEFRRAA